MGMRKPKSVSTISDLANQHGINYRTLKARVRAITKTKQYDWMRVGNTIVVTPQEIKDLGLLTAREMGRPKGSVDEMVADVKPAPIPPTIEPKQWTLGSQKLTYTPKPRPADDDDAIDSDEFHSPFGKGAI
jgi:hypothetical protein